MGLWRMGKAGWMRFFPVFHPVGLIRLGRCILPEAGRLRNRHTVPKHLFHRLFLFRVHEMAAADEAVVGVGEEEDEFPLGGDDGP
jgi:hypothetical protein